MQLHHIFSETLATSTNPANLSDEEFATMVARIRAGEVRAIRARARVFIDAPNRNHVRPKPGQIPALAASAAGALFLDGHADTEESRLGTVVSGEVGTHNGNAALILAWDITEPGAQERWIRGQMDRFSVGLGASRAECSVCGADGMRCEHKRGDSYGGRLAELFLVGASLRELSNVNFPAVPDTAVLSVSKPKVPVMNAQTAEIAALKARLAALEGAKARVNNVPEVDDLALAKFSRRIRRRHVSVDRLEQIGFYDLRVVDNQ
jgi:hypothetical protein